MSMAIIRRKLLLHQVLSSFCSNSAIPFVGLVDSYPISYEDKNYGKSQVQLNLTLQRLAMLLAILHYKKYQDETGKSDCTRSTTPSSPISKVKVSNGSTKLSKKVRSILLLNVITVVDASNFTFVKEVETVMDPAAFAVVRFALCAVPFIPFVMRARSDVYTRNAGIELGFWVSLGYLTQALGLLTSDAGRASFLSMFTVIIVPLVDGMLGAAIPAYVWFGSLISIVGVGLLESSGSSPSVGDLLNLLSAVFFGVHMLRTEQISKNTKRENYLPLLGYEICVVASSSALWYLIGAWSSGGLLDLRPSLWTWDMLWQWMLVFPWLPAVYTGIFSTVICSWVEMTAMCNVSATETATIYGLEPVWGAVFAWFLLGERYASTGLIGAALVLGGSLTVQILGSTSLREPSKLLISTETSTKSKTVQQPA